MRKVIVGKQGGESHVGRRRLAWGLPRARVGNGVPRRKAPHLDPALRASEIADVAEDFVEVGKGVEVRVGVGPGNDELVRWRYECVEDLRRARRGHVVPSVALTGRRN